MNAGPWIMHAFLFSAFSIGPVSQSEAWCWGGCGIRMRRKFQRICVCYISHRVPSLVWGSGVTDDE